MTAFEYLVLALRHKKDPLFVKYLMGRRVLDIGSGRGEFLSRDPERFVGADIDPALVSVCLAHGLKAHCMDALALEFSEASFDAVHAAQLIEHFPPDKAVRFLKEAARVIRPGGYVFLTVPGVKNVWNTFSHIRPYPPDAFRKLLTNDTENYLCLSPVDLAFERAWGWRRYCHNRVLMFLSALADLLFPTSNPIGWTILLRKKPAV